MNGCESEETWGGFRVYFKFSSSFSCLFFSLIIVVHFRNTKWNEHNGVSRFGLNWKGSLALLYFGLAFGRPSFWMTIFIPFFFVFYIYAILPCLFFFF